MRRKLSGLAVFSGLILGCVTAFAQPCSTQSSKLACVIPQEYGTNAFDFTNVLYTVGRHATHFNSGSGDIQSRLAPLTSEIGREANLLPLASPSSGVVLIYDPALKTYVVSKDSLGPILGERGETVGRHRIFVGFSYQFFDFDKIDGVNLHSFPAVLTHTDDAFDNSPNAVPGVPCSINNSVNSTVNLGGCAFVRDRVSTLNSIDLHVNQYTSYLTFGLTRHIDLSLVIPVENVRMGLSSQDTIVLGESGFYTPAPLSPDATNKNQCIYSGGADQCNSNGAPYFFHLFKDCPNTSPPSGATGLAPACLNHTFPDPAFTGSGSNPRNSAFGIGDMVARVKWNAWSSERIRLAGGLDVRFPTGDALNYLGSGSYGVKPFAVLSYRARISPHVLVGYEFNSRSILSGIATGEKGYVPSDFIYTAGADAAVTKWLTGSFDVIGQRFFRGGTESVTTQQFLAPCTGSCTAAPTPGTVGAPNLTENPNASYNITNASAGIKVRPLPKVSKLVLTANVLVRLDDGGLHSKPVPLAGIGYTF